MILLRYNVFTFVTGGEIDFVNVCNTHKGKNMYIFLLYFTLMLAIAQFNIVLPAETQENNELEMGVIKKPEKCDRSSRTGDILSVHYRGSLDDGTEFDSSYDQKEPFQFQLGTGQVIKGWDQGLISMCVGEQRRLTIPPHFGYGDSGAGERIPPNATLIFEVELLEIKDGPPPVNVFKEIDANADNQLSREELSFQHGIPCSTSGT
ncbi:peptidyl-prolyl cis-trans isomerase FKBP2-like isoform X2 [Limulus polyphemus]|uniref:peptidylprolyl isomerase n=1 Tax=Limulus polyphemus TaxID=6850 RepID=A0ABM1TPR3_LIMPO|nr:peptidyl-prolyl cis-trans isomerase FKBP2-like isoform X2 [Limulus polyphemus]